ncbi:MAG: hypothetical protein OEL83_15750 [Desulforhopalus sp.]|nr:hypothetical protein [Desulforhopalus sp.]
MAETKHVPLQDTDLLPMPVLLLNTFSGNGEKAQIYTTWAGNLQQASGYGGCFWL